MFVWQPVLEPLGNDGVCAKAPTSQAASWFEGHFPGTPILPGIAMLALVEQTLRSWTERSGSPEVVTGFQRVRFRLPVLPGAILSVVVTRNQQLERAYQFRVESDGQAACTGTCFV